MTSIDVAPYNRKFDPKRLDVLNRQMFVPACDKVCTVVSGPSEKLVALAPTNEVNHELSELLGLFGGIWFDHGPSDLVSDHMPLTFTISPSGRENIKIAVFVMSVDYEPDRSAYPEAFFEDNYRRQLGERTMLIHGWCVFIPVEKVSALKRSLRELSLFPCMLSYNPRGGADRGARGNFVMISKEQPLPSTQVISSLGALRAILSDNYADCFIESYAPDKKTRWGYLSSSRGNYSDDLLELRALDNGNGVWKFRYPQDKNFLGIHLFGVVRTKDSHDVTLAGDVTLSADGVIFHSYYLSQAEKIEELRQRGIQNPSVEYLNDGYYFNRIYPKDSKRLPLEMIRSFNEQMP